MKYPDKKVCVIDTGGYIPVAQKLSEQFGKVYYYTFWERGFPTSNDTIIGSGFKEFERIDHLFDKIDEIDLFVFTDMYNSDLQEYLVKIGKRVWGCRGGSAMEMHRWEFFEYLKKLGLPVAPTELVIGIDELRKKLEKIEDKYIKVDSMFRGDIETFHHVNYEITKPILDKLEYEIGPRKNTIRFIVQDPIPTKAEIGYDGYCINGKFPNECLFGIEIKDKGYIGGIRPYSDIPNELKEINDALETTLESYGYCGNLSTEVRIGEDGKAYLTDITCRFPSPPTAVWLEVINSESLAEIMYEGGNGKMIQPKFDYKFGAEIIGLSEFAKEGNFTQLYYPEKDSKYIKQAYSCVVDDKVNIIPQSWINERVCEVVSVGDNLESVVKELQDRCSWVIGHRITLDCSVLNEGIEEFKKL